MNKKIVGDLCMHSEYINLILWYIFYNDFESQFLQLTIAKKKDKFKEVLGIQVIKVFFHFCILKWFQNLPFYIFIFHSGKGEGIPVFQIAVHMSPFRFCCCCCCCCSVRVTMSKTDPAVLGCTCTVMHFLPIMSLATYTVQSRASVRKKMWSFYSPSHLHVIMRTQPV